MPQLPLAPSHPFARFALAAILIWLTTAPVRVCADGKTPRQEFRVALQARSDQWDPAALDQCADDLWKLMLARTKDPTPEQIGQIAEGLKLNTQGQPAITSIIHPLHREFIRQWMLNSEHEFLEVGPPDANQTSMLRVQIKDAIDAFGGQLRERYPLSSKDIDEATAAAKNDFARLIRDPFSLRYRKAMTDTVQEHVRTSGRKQLEALPAPDSSKAPSSTDFRLAMHRAITLGIKDSCAIPRPAPLEAYVVAKKAYEAKIGEIVEWENAERARRDYEQKLAEQERARRAR